jgi:hypothetical protein
VDKTAYFLVCNMWKVDTRPIRFFRISSRIHKKISILKSSTHGKIFEIILKVWDGMTQQLVYRSYFEPLNRRLQQPRKILVHIGDVVQLVSNRVVHIDTDQLPVRFAFVDQRNGSKNFHLDHLTSLCHPVADLQHIDWVVVTLATGGRVQVVGILPGLGQGAVVPNVTVVRETVGHVAQLALFHVLFDGVERVGQRNLRNGKKLLVVSYGEAVSKHSKYIIYEMK